MLRRETDLVGNDIYIGETMFENSNVTRLIPYAVARPEGWLQTERSQFPEEGCVFSVDPKVVRKPQGHVVLFTMEVNSRSPGRDRYITVETEEPYEIFDLLNESGPVELRNTLIDKGVRRYSQEEPRIIIPFSDGKCAFPRMQRIGTAPAWTLSYQEELDRVGLYATHQDGFGWIEIEGRKFVLPGRQPKDLVGWVNWQKDGEFLQVLLKRIRKSANLRPGTDDFKLNDQTVRRLTALYRDADIINDHEGANVAALERLGEFLSKLSSETTAVAEIVDALLNHTDILQRLIEVSEEEMNALRLREIERVRPEIVRQVEEEISDRRTALDTLRTDAAQIEQELSRKSDELNRVEGLVEGGLATLRTGLGAFAIDIRETGRILSEVKEFAGVGREATTPSPTLTTTVAFAAAPWTMDVSSPGLPISLDELPARARAASKAFGLTEDQIRRLDIFCRAGEIPRISGDSAERLLDGYAGVVASGHLVRMPLDPTTLGPNDLWRQSSTGAPTPFAEAWTAAVEDPAKVRLVCLDDLDRASLSDWFGRFQILFRAKRPANLLVVATLSPPIAANSDDKSAQGLDTQVIANGARASFAAAVMKGGANASPPSHVESPILRIVGAEERKTLLEKLHTAADCGGDVGLRLVAIYAAARSWLDEDPASEFALSTVSKKAGSKIGGQSGGAIGGLAANAQNDWKRTS
ncbi:hypothetical protein [Methylobacterium bullatum]